MVLPPQNISLWHIGRGTIPVQHFCVNMRRQSFGPVGMTLLYFALFAAAPALAQSRSQSKTANNETATLQDSLELYNNAIEVETFYEKQGRYIKTRETRLLSTDAATLHAGNDKKYADVLRTINNERYTSQGKRKIKAEEYRVNLNKHKYKQRELSDYVLNTEAPMQLFDRRIAPQILVDYTFTGRKDNPINDDDVDFKKYDPVAIKPYSMLTATEKQERSVKYPLVVAPPIVVAPVLPPTKPLTKAPVPKPKPSVAAPDSDFVISGPVPDSIRFKRFKSKKEAEDFIESLRRDDAGE